MEGSVALRRRASLGSLLVAQGAALGLALVAACLISAAAGAQVIEGAEEKGKGRYIDYCAVCHGTEGRGDGPFANLLEKQPADLTKLSANAGGQFPFFRVAEIIDGRAEVGGAHGTREMPIWGTQWRTTETMANESALRGQVFEVILYLKSIQE